MRVIRLGDADDQLALDEGEGFRSVAGWARGPRNVLEKQDAAALRTSDGVSLDDDTEVVVEGSASLGSPRRELMPHLRRPQACDVGSRAPVARGGTRLPSRDLGAVLLGHARGCHQLAD